MKRRKIEHFASESDQKAAVAERFNRTIKTRIWTYLLTEAPCAGLTSSEQLVDAYNHSRHRSIGMAPADVEKQRRGPHLDTTLWRWRHAPESTNA